MERKGWRGPGRVGTGKVLGGIMESWSILRDGCTE